MVGLGAQDNLEMAEEFVATYGTTFMMLWDESFESWAKLGVALQPAAILLGSDGQLLGKWLGRIPEDEVLAIVAGAPPVGEVAGNSTRFCRYAARYVQADAALETVETRSPIARPIVFDDIRFAANAMAQTASADLAPNVGVFAAAVLAVADSAIGADHDLAAARATGRYDELVAELAAAATAIGGAVDAACDVDFAAM